MEILKRKSFLQRKRRVNRRAMLEPVTGCGIAFLLLLTLILFSIILLCFEETEQSGIGRANISGECERYRPLVEKYANQHGVSDFIEIIMCIMMQESGGRFPDLMQCSECPFNKEYPQRKNGITDPEYSIDVGIQNYKACLQNAGCVDVTDMNGVKLSLQDYNFGNGYAVWARQNYGTYSQQNARIFSNMWAARLGWSKYGDPEYVTHVLRYYMIPEEYSTDEISNPEAVSQLEVLVKSWPEVMDERRGSVISKGAGLIGKVSYDMYGADTRSGTDHPRTLDCSSFVAWAFQKSGFTDVPYTSTTGTYVSAGNFKRISAAELIPGDIGLINMIPAGGSNHVGIYAGKDQNGTAMWLHCTSRATIGSSTVTNGPRISYYTSFAIYYRYTGFRD